MGLGFNLLLLIHSFTTFLVYYSYKRLKNHKANTNNNSKTGSITNFQIAEFIYKVNVIMFLLFPLYAFNIEFFRICRNMYILFYILFSIVINYGIIKKIEQYIFQILIFILIVFLTLNFILISFYDTVFHPLFFNNLFFS